MQFTLNAREQPGESGWSVFENRRCRSFILAGHPVPSIRDRMTLLRDCRFSPVSRQLFRFALAGGLGFVVDAGVLYVALAGGLGPFAGRGVSFVAAVWTTWRVNRRYTCRERAERSAWGEWWRYLLSMLGGAAVNYLAYTVVVLTLDAGRLTPLIGVACGAVAGLFVNFAAAKHWAFRR